MLRDKDVSIFSTAAPSKKMLKYKKTKRPQENDIPFITNRGCPGMRMRKWWR